MSEDMNVQTFAEQIAVEQARNHQREKDLNEIIQEMLEACETVHRNLNKAWGNQTSGFEHALIATLELAIARAEKQ